MEQLELFDYRKDYLFKSSNQIAHYYDILKETEDTISYAEHIDPNKGYAIAGMEYEEYIDVKKDRLKGLTYDTKNWLYFFLSILVVIEDSKIVYSFLKSKSDVSILILIIPYGTKLIFSIVYQCF